MTAEDPTVAGHAFQPPEGQPWGLCAFELPIGVGPNVRRCGMAQAAHADPGAPYVPSARYENGDSLAVNTDGRVARLPRVRMRHSR